MGQSGFSEALDGEIAFGDWDRVFKKACYWSACMVEFKIVSAMDGELILEVWQLERVTIRLTRGK